jgi:hypothetical protein
MKIKSVIITLAITFVPKLTLAESRILNQASVLSGLNIDILLGSSILIVGLPILFIIWLVWYKNKNIKYEIPVQYTPPKNLSPAGVGYLRYRRPNPRLISALMISLARQGIIKITQNFDRKFWQRSKYTFDMVDKEKAKAVNYMGEAFLIESLFRYYLMVNNPLFLHFRAIISKKYSRDIGIDAVICGCIILVLLYFLELNPIISYTLLGVSILIIKEDNLNEIYKAIYLEEVAQYHIKIPLFIKALLVLITRVGTPLFVVLYIFGYPIIATATLIILIISTILNGSIPRRTQSGDEMMAYILGLEEYIIVAEKHRLDFQGKNYLFFDMLPYAIALGHAKVWGKAFEGMVVYNPDWFDSTSKYRPPFSSGLLYDTIIYSTRRSITRLNSRAYSSHSSSERGSW